jgi:dTDP-4-dehydrorhamnose reductase
MGKKKVILVSGANGQLGQTLIENQDHYKQNYDFIFLNREELDLSSDESIEDKFVKLQPDIFFNFAAYTQVDKAEEQETEAFLINEKACKTIAKLCTEYNCHLIHISTDYVYAGKGNVAFKEEDTTNPINVYGKSKLAGEEAILQNCTSSTIIRTSWLYSRHRNNFVKSMIRLGQERASLNVVNDQKGSPTWTEDLIHAIFVLLEKKQFGVFNFSNEGSCTWFEFAKSIMDIQNIDCKINPITSSDFPTAAKRPAFSLMDKSKIKKHLDISIPHWEESLRKALKTF